MEAGFCGGFVAQWFMVALVRHPGFESRSCRFFAFLLSLQQAGFQLMFVTNYVKKKLKLLLFFEEDLGLLFTAASFAGRLVNVFSLVKGS